MDARLVWDTWRRILNNDQLVEVVLRPKYAGEVEAIGLTAGEIAILADYASTPVATDTNIAMYRSGLVRNALAALSFVPLTQNLFYASGLGVEAVAADFVKSTGYVDHGPNFWWLAGAFVTYLSRLPEFATPLQQDVLQLEAEAVALARRLGQFPVEVWPENVASIFSEVHPGSDHQSARFLASGAAVVASSNYDLTAWIENPEDFDVKEELEPSERHWLIYFPAAEAVPGYAELSERSARAFRFLSSPKTADEVSVDLGDLVITEVMAVLNSLAELGVIARDENSLMSKAKETPRETGVAVIT